MMTSQTVYTAIPESQMWPMAGSPVKQRYLLYIVSRGARALAPDIFSAMRRDMTGASVELIYDRRVGERRAQSANIDQNRRASDRRRLDASPDIAARGWARVEVK